MTPQGTVVGAWQPVGAGFCCAGSPAPRGAIPRGRRVAQADMSSGAIVTPGDVLAYRKMWDGYVIATVKLLGVCGDAWAELAAGGSPATHPNTAKFAVPPDAKTLQLKADTMHGYADNLLSSWNSHAGMSDSDLVLEASAVLQDFQAVITKIGQFYEPELQSDCPSLTLPSPPGVDVQSQVIGQIEGLGILAHGVLQLFAVGASGALETYGAIAKTAASVATAAAGSVGTVALGLGLGLLALAMLKGRRA